MPLVIYLRVIGLILIEYLLTMLEGSHLALSCMTDK